MAKKKVPITINEAMEILVDMSAEPFSANFSKEQLYKNTANKGLIGCLLEEAIGLEHNSETLDFIDGELKTQGLTAKGTPKETLSITMLNQEFDNYIIKDFNPRNCHAYKKLQTFIYCGYDVSSNARENWKIKKLYLISENNPIFAEFYKQFQEDLKNIASKMREIAFSKDQKIETINGKFFQLRTKGQGHGKGAIKSKLANRQVSDSSYAFYMTTDGIKYLMEVAENYAC